MRWNFQQISIFHCSGKAMPLLNPLISAMLWKIEIKKKLKSANWNSQNLKSRTNLESKLQRPHPILFKTGLVSACSIHVGTQQAGHCTKTADLVTFTEEIFNGKLRVLCSGFCSLQFLPLLCFSGKTERKSYWIRHIKRLNSLFFVYLFWKWAGTFKNFQFLIFG